VSDYRCEDDCASPRCPAKLERERNMLVSFECEHGVAPARDCFLCGLARRDAERWACTVLAFVGVAVLVGRYDDNLVDACNELQLRGWPDQALEHERSRLLDLIGEDL
jgi:hypothetical protein